MSRDLPETRAAADEALTLLVEGLETTPHEATAGVRAQLLAELHGRERWTPWTRPVAALLAIPDEDALYALQQIDDSTAWRAGFWANSQYLQTPKLAAVHALIARLPPGTRIARHRHVRRELTFVLDGQLVEDDSRSYGRGELADMPAGTEHEVAVTGTKDCLVVFFLPQE